MKWFSILVTCLIACSILVFIPGIINKLATLYTFNAVNFGNAKVDFDEYLVGAHIVLDGLGHLLYKFSTQHQYLIELTGSVSGPLYLYLPVYTILFIPFTLFDRSTAFLLFTLVNVSLTLCSLAKVKLIYSESTKFIFWYILPFAYFPYLRTITLGQVSILLFFLFVVMLYFVKHRKYFLLGLVSGLVSLKIQYLIFLPFLFILVKNRKEFIYGLFISLFTIVLSSFLITGAALYVDYFNFVVSVNQIFQLTMSNIDFSMFQLIEPLRLVPNITLLFTLNAALYFPILIFIYCRRNLFSEDIVFHTGIICALLFSSHTVITDLSLLLLPMYYLLQSYKLTNSLQHAVFFLALFLLPYLIYAPVAVMWLSLLFFNLMIFSFLSTKSLLLKKSSSEEIYSN